ncbi:hypothetical protein LSAT2_007580 [Lamellibrachia satsuma]|nr:hypothetical protein LSAT2_007580 [Lamellibrachia satsuma]
MVATCVDEMELDDEGLGDVDSEDKITLNVGGVAHETLLSTLAKKPGTRLSELAKEHARGDEVTNEYYFNRNPRVFNTVIDYYRSGVVGGHRLLQEWWVVIDYYRSGVVGDHRLLQEWSGGWSSTTTGVVGDHRLLQEWWVIIDYYRSGVVGGHRLLQEWWVIIDYYRSGVVGDHRLLQEWWVVIDYYKGGELHVPLDVCGAVVKRELDFWHIRDCEIEPCCWVSYSSYIDKQKTLAEFNANEEKEKAELAAIEHLTGWRRRQADVWAVLDHPMSSRLALSLMDASTKVLRIIKARYLSSSAIVTHANCDGAKGKSNVLAIRCGVLQGYIFSPLLFCVCPYCIFRDHDVPCEGIYVSIDPIIECRISELELNTLCAPPSKPHSEQFPFEASHSKQCSMSSTSGPGLKARCVRSRRETSSSCRGREVHLAMVVQSMMTYGYEGWYVDETSQRTLNGTNAWISAVICPRRSVIIIIRRCGSRRVTQMGVV